MKTSHNHSHSSHQSAAVSLHDTCQFPVPVSRLRTVHAYGPCHFYDLFHSCATLKASASARASVSYNQYYSYVSATPTASHPLDSVTPVNNATSTASAIPTPSVQLTRPGQCKRICNLWKLVTSGSQKGVGAAVAQAKKERKENSKSSQRGI